MRFDLLILKKIEHEDIDSFFELCSDDVLYEYKPSKAKKNKKVEILPTR